MSGSFSSTAGFADLSYPSGLTQNNSRVISFEAGYDNLGMAQTAYRTGVGIVGSSSPGRLFISLDPTVIRVYNDSEFFYGRPFRILLYKID